MEVPPKFRYFRLDRRYINKYEKLYEIFLHRIMLINEKIAEMKSSPIFHFILPPSMLIAYLQKKIFRPLMDRSIKRYRHGAGLGIIEYFKEIQKHEGIIYSETFSILPETRSFN